MMPKPIETVEDRLLQAAAEYLQTKGFTPLVISADRVQGPVDRSYNYELVIRFTGRRDDNREMSQQ